MRLAGNGADIGIQLQRVADLEGARFGGDQLREFFMNCALDQKPRSSHTDLARVAKDATRADPGGLFQIGRIGEDDIGRLAAQLQIKPFQVGARAVFHQLAPDKTGAGKDQHIDIPMKAQCLPGHRALPGDQVQNAVGQAAFGADLHQPQQAERCHLGGFEHHRIARRQRRRDLPRGNHQREIPRHDRPDHADRLAVDQPQNPGLRRGDFAGQFVDRLGIEPKGRGGAARLGLDRHADLGAVVAHPAHGQRQRLGLDRVGNLVQHFLALDRGGAGPDPRLEHATGRGHGGIDIRRAGIGDAAQALPVNRRGHDHARARLRRTPLSIDEQPLIGHGLRRQHVDCRLIHDMQSFGLAVSKT